MDPDEAASILPLDHCHVHLRNAMRGRRLTVTRQCRCVSAPTPAPEQGSSSIVIIVVVQMTPG